MFSYEEDDWSALYIRNDVATERLRDTVADIIERTREARALVREEDYEELGEKTATTEVHESGVILHFPQGDQRGIIISLDREAARRLTAFVSQCATIIHSPATSTFEAQLTTD